MKASPSLLAVLLLLSSTSLAQTATSPQTAPAQEAAPTQQAPAQPTAQDQAPAQPAPTQQAAMAQPAPPAPSTGTAAPSADVPPATAAAQLLAPGAKIYIEPMNGFDQDMVEAITRKKVPVVVVKQRAQADFVLTGEAHLKEHGWVASNVLFPHGGVNIALNDARTGNVVFACKSKRVDAMTADGQIFQNWADGCAGHLKKQMKQK